MRFKTCGMEAALGRNDYFSIQKHLQAYMIHSLSYCFILWLLFSCLHISSGTHLLYLYAIEIIYKHTAICPFITP